MWDIILILILLIGMISFMIGVLMGTTMPAFIAYLVATIVLQISVWYFKNDIVDINEPFLFFFRISMAVIMLVVCPVYIVLDRRMGLRAVAQAKYYAIDGIKTTDWSVFVLFFAFWAVWGVGLGVLMYDLAGDYWPIICAVIGLLIGVLMAAFGYQTTPTRMAYCDSRDALLQRIKYLQDVINSQLAFSQGASFNKEVYLRYMQALDDLNREVRASLYTAEIDVLEKRALNTINIIIDRTNYTEEGLRMIFAIINDYKFGGRIM